MPISRPAGHRRKLLTPRGGGGISLRWEEVRTRLGRIPVHPDRRAAHLHGTRAIRGVALSVLLVGCGETRYDQDAEQYECATCRISIELVTTIDADQADANSPTPRSSILRHPDGHVVVAPVYQRARVAVFSNEGALITAFGEPGSGPGELGRPDAIALHADTVFVLDNSNARISTYTLAGQYVRHIPIRHIATGIAVVNDTLIVLGVLRSGPAPQHRPLVLMDKSGAVIAEFGEVDPRTANNILFSVAAADSIWLGHFGEYRVDLFETTGRSLSSIHRNVQWFPPFNFVRGVKARSKTFIFTALVDLQVAPEGLWTLVGTASVSRSPDTRDRPSIRPMSVGEIDARTDYILELVDVESGRALAGTALQDGMFGGFADARHVFSFSEGRSGQVYAHIWTVQLHNTISGGDYEADSTVLHGGTYSGPRLIDGRDHRCVRHLPRNLHLGLLEH